MPEAHHLALSRGDLAGARIAVLPGDPGRVPAIAAGLARSLAGDARELSANREYRSALVQGGVGPALVLSTGIGGPSTAIAVEELARLGVDTFIRAGTTGVLPEHIEPGDVIISSGAVRLDGASTHYAPIEYPAVAHPTVTAALLVGARHTGIRHHLGITASSDTFYPGQERYDTFSGYVIRRFQGSAEEWRRLHVLNYEMEAATLFVVASTMGLRAGAVCGVLVNRTQTERIDPELVTRVEANTIAVACEAVRRLLEGGE